VEAQTALRFARPVCVGFHILPSSTSGGCPGVTGRERRSCSQVRRIP
jgi:hypothetical protein